MVIYGRNAGGDGDIEGNRGAVVLRHVGRDGVAAEGSLRFEQSEIESIRVLVQRLGRPESRDSATDNGNSSRQSRTSLHVRDPGLERI